MKRPFSSIIIDILLYLLSIALALGTINPFSIDPTVEAESELVLMPILAVSFSIIVLFRYGLKGIPKIVIVSAILFFVGCMIGDFLYDYYSTDYWFLAKLFSVLLFFFSCIIYFSNNPEKIKVSLIIYSISCVVVLVVVYFFSNSGIVEISKGRMSIFGENANSTSSRMLIAALFFLYDLINNRRNNIIKVLELLSLLLLLLFIIQSGSRGSLISVMVGIVIMIAFSDIKTTRKTILIIVGLVVVAIAIPWLIHNENISIFERLQELEEGNVRSTLMLNAIDIYKDYPFFGAGSNGYQVEKMNRYYSSLDSHCILTSIMAIGGTFALFFFICLWIIIFKKTLQIRKTNIFPIIVFLCITLIALKTGGVITFVFMWYCYAISYAMSAKTTQ